jgi:hypothetical protein
VLENDIQDLVDENSSLTIEKCDLDGELAKKQAKVLDLEAAQRLRDRELRSLRSKRASLMANLPPPTKRQDHLIVLSKPEDERVFTILVRRGLDAANNQVRVLAKDGYTHVVARYDGLMNGRKTLTAMLALIYASHNLKKVLMQRHVVANKLCEMCMRSDTTQKRQCWQFPQDVDIEVVVRAAMTEVLAMVL